MLHENCRFSVQEIRELSQKTNMRVKRQDANIPSLLAHRPSDHSSLNSDINHSPPFFLNPDMLFFSTLEPTEATRSPKYGALGETEAAPQAASGWRDLYDDGLRRREPASRRQRAVHHTRMQTPGERSMVNRISSSGLAGRKAIEGTPVGGTEQRTRRP